MQGVYPEIIKKSFQQRAVYKIDSYLSIIGSLITLFIQISLWYALMGNGGSIGGISFQDMFNYLIINTVVLALVYSNAGNELAKKVQDGSIAIDLIRPTSLKYFLLSQDLGNNLFVVVFSVLPVCLVSIAIFGFRLPSDIIRICLFLLSLVNGIIIIFLINYIFGLLAFWLKSTWYISWYTGALFKLFGGTFVPIWFYPRFLQNISEALPFRLVTFEPISIFTGKLSLASSAYVILYQLIWIVILNITEKLVWNRAQSKISIQGG